MCEFDLVGFQTQHAAHNFITAAHGAPRGRRLPAIGVFPATIDREPFTEGQTEEIREVAGLREALGARKLILGVDRLDYSKGIPERLLAYERLLERYPEWRRRVALLQVSVPTRAEIPDYAELRERVEGMVGRINGQYGDTDWVPVRYLYRSYDQHVLAQLYRLADVALVTPLRDGMNLVAKEYVACRDSLDGALVLSEFAGAADELKQAFLVNPYDINGMKQAIVDATQAPPKELTRRMRAMRKTVKEHDIAAWAAQFMGRLDEARPTHHKRLRPSEADSDGS
jgi:trehalose-6-phosphate synthase